MFIVPYLVAAYLAFNIYAYLLMGSDKKRAVNGEFRVPERKLLLIALFGGSVGIYKGMKGYRHKTKHRRFSLGVPFIMAVQGCVLAYCVYRYAVHLIG